MATSSDGKVTLSAAVPISLKERIQRIAAERRWTLSQTIVIFLEEYLDTWEKDLGTAPTQKRSPSPKQGKR